MSVVPFSSYRVGLLISTLPPLILSIPHFTPPLSYQSTPCYYYGSRKGVFMVSFGHEKLALLFLELQHVRVVNEVLFSSALSNFTAIAMSCVNFLEDIDRHIITIMVSTFRVRFLQRTQSMTMQILLLGMCMATTSTPEVRYG